MFEYKSNVTTLQTDFKKGCVISLKHPGRELVADRKTPLFTINMMDSYGETTRFSSFDTKTCYVTKYNFFTVFGIYVSRQRTLHRCSR